MTANDALKEVNKEGKRKVMIRQQWIWVAALIGGIFGGILGWIIRGWFIG